MWEEMRFKFSVEVWVVKFFSVLRHFAEKICENLNLDIIIILKMGPNCV